MEFDESDFRAKLLTFFFFVPIFGKIEVKDLLNELNAKIVIKFKSIVCYINTTNLNFIDLINFRIIEF